MEKEKRYACVDCGELLGSDARYCPSCGRAKKRVLVVARDTVQAHGEIIEEAKIQLGKIKHESAPRTKRARTR